MTDEKSEKSWETIAREEAIAEQRRRERLEHTVDELCNLVATILGFGAGYLAYRVVGDWGFGESLRLIASVVAYGFASATIVRSLQWREERTSVQKRRLRRIDAVLDHSMFVFGVGGIGYLLWGLWSWLQ